MIKKTFVIVAVYTLSLFLLSCGGQNERAKDIPTQAEALETATHDMGIIGAKVLAAEDVRAKGSEYYGIDAVYTMSCDRIDEFTLLRSWTYDTLFWGGYSYNWITDYSDVVMEDYLKDHALPDGIFYSEGPYARSNYGAQRFFSKSGKQIWFEFSSDEEFESYLDKLQPWLDEWLSFERSYLTDGSDPQIQVIAYRPQDDTMNYSIQIYRSFGYKKDSFHSLGEDGETYTWDSFKKAMSAGYNAQKKLKMKQK
ncbi:MAG: hypothetical protein IKR47_01885 [Lachnospiraceae bacterium]|nr:hypothetical protein [Lachnospiraceae bacterium]